MRKRWLLVSVFMAALGIVAILARPRAADDFAFVRDFPHRQELVEIRDWKGRSQWDLVIEFKERTPELLARLREHSNADWPSDRMVVKTKDGRSGTFDYMTCKLTFKHYTPPPWLEVQWIGLRRHLGF